MPKDNSYLEYILYDVLGHIDGITSKSMFSGWGIYLDGTIVGIITGGELFLKADKELMAKYKKEGLHSFTYPDSKGKPHEISYMSVPEEVFEDREKIRERVLESFDISRTAKTKKK